MDGDDPTMIMMMNEAGLSYSLLPPNHHNNNHILQILPVATGGQRIWWWLTEAAEEKVISVDLNNVYNIELIY